MQHTSIKYGGSTLDGVLLLLIRWIGFVQLCNEIADEASSSGPCCLHNHVEAQSYIRLYTYNLLLNFFKWLVDEPFADSSCLLCDLFEMGPGHPVRDIFDYKGGVRCSYHDVAGSWKCARNGKLSTSQRSGSTPSAKYSLTRWARVR